MGIFNRTRKSERVEGKCCICGSKIEFIYSPADRQEKLLMHSYTDIEVVNICKGCETLRHVRCIRERRDKVKSETLGMSSGPTFFDALKGAVEGGEHGRDAFLKVIDRETKELDCPSCGSFEFLEAFAKRDGSLIKIKSGKRIE